MIVIYFISQVTDYGTDSRNHAIHYTLCCTSHMTVITVLYKSHNCGHYMILIAGG